MNKEQNFSSMHTHTIFCDGNNDVETMCRTAHEKNLYAIGFSAHAPVEKQTGIKSEWCMKEEKVNEYVTEVLAAKDRWHGKLKVFLGMEVDFIKGKRSPLDSDITALNLDYIIGSVHYIFPENGAAPFTVDDSNEEFERGIKDGFKGEAENLMHCYYDAVLEMIDKGGFDILGHADLIKKNSQNKNLWPKENELRRQREVAAAASKKDLIIEINTGGINRKKINDVYPSLSFLHIINEYNIPVIITADAHCIEDLDKNYKIAIDTLLLADFKEHVLFNGKNITEQEWIKKKL
ncbi:MAG: histidinol-phosphatase [Treponema sp.]|nr:histidinol-phosphatase [Treponema sp.]